MNTRAALHQCKHSPFPLSTFGISRVPTAISRPRFKPRQFPQYRSKPPRAHFSISTRMSPVPPTNINGEFQQSHRTPDRPTKYNTADEIERLMQMDGFGKWGFVIYRCTYASESEWDACMVRIYRAVKEFLELCNGLDMLDCFAPTVIQDREAFDGATTTAVREHFVNTWVPSSFPEENPGIDIDILRNAEAGRYRFFIMVDEESLRSVLEAQEDRINHTGFVRLVQADWGTKRSNIVEDEEEEEFAPVPGWDECEPLEGCILQDVGWMNVQYNHVEVLGYLNIKMDWDWDDHYCRPPEIVRIF